MRILGVYTQSQIYEYTPTLPLFFIMDMFSLIFCFFTVRFHTFLYSDFLNRKFIKIFCQSQGFSIKLKRLKHVDLKT